MPCAERRRARRPPKHKEAGGGLGGRAQRLPPSALAGGLTLCCRCLVLVLVVAAAVVVFARSVAVRGGNLKNREAGGGLGGRAQRLPPTALAGGLTLRCRCLVLVLVLVVAAGVVVFARSVAMRGGLLKNREAGGGLGGRAQRLPPSALAGGLTFIWL